MDELDETAKEIKQTGYLSRRFTKKDTMSKEWDYYVNLESAENDDVSIAYFKGRIKSDIIEKLGLLEDILEDISITQLLSLRRAIKRK